MVIGMVQRDIDMNEEEYDKQVEKAGGGELVSVIMPVYNGQDYIAETINCVLAQSHENLELIVVDDGSTDQTAAIIDDLAKKDSRISCYHREKSNAGVQRNYGFEKSKGRFVLFLDGDDLFERDMAELMLDKLIMDNAEICVCNADQYDTERKEYIPKPQYLRKKVLPDITPFSREELGRNILYFTSLVPWNKMFKRSFIEENGLYFQDIERANDQYFSVLALILAKRITIVDRVLVHYRIKQKGNLTTEFSNTPLNSYQAMLKASGRLQELGLFEDFSVRCAFDNKVLNIMIFSLHIQKDIDGFQVLYNTLQSEGFDKLGIGLKEADYYIDPLEYENLRLILEIPYDEYLLIKSREYRDVIADKNLAYRNMVAQKNEKIAELKEKEKELNGIKRKNWYKKITGFIAWYHRLIGKED